MLIVYSEGISPRISSDANEKNVLKINKNKNITASLVPFSKIGYNNAHKLTRLHLPLPATSSYYIQRY